MQILRCRFILSVSASLHHTTCIIVSDCDSPASSSFSRCSACQINFSIKTRPPFSLSPSLSLSLSWTHHLLPPSPPRAIPCACVKVFPPPWIAFSVLSTAVSTVQEGWRLYLSCKYVFGASTPSVSFRAGGDSARNEKRCGLTSGS